MKLAFRSEQYGILTLWIMLLHLDMFFHPLLGNVYLGRIASFGECCVDIFLFLSGYCIYSAWTRDSNYQSFIRRRVRRLIPSYLIIAIPYLIWKQWRNGTWQDSGTILHHCGNFVYDLTGLSFLLDGMSEVWFPIAIMFFYLATPLLLTVLKGRKGPWVLAFSIVLVAFLIKNVPFFTRSGLLWSRLPAYLFGLLYASQGKDLNNLVHCKGIYIWIFGILLAGLICSPLIPMARSYMGDHLTRLLYLLIILPMIALAIRVISSLPTILQRVLGFIGEQSFEIYLLHLLLLYVVSNHGWNVWLYPACLVLSIPLAYCVRKLVGS